MSTAVASTPQTWNHSTTALFTEIIVNCLKARCCDELIFHFTTFWGTAVKVPLVLMGNCVIKVQLEEECRTSSEFHSESRISQKLMQEPPSFGRWSRGGGLARRTESSMFQPAPSPSQIGDQSGGGTKDVRTPQPGDPSFGQLNLTFIPVRSFAIWRIKVESGLEEEWSQMTTLRLGWGETESLIRLRLCLQTFFTTLRPNCWYVNILYKIRAAFWISSGAKHQKGNVLLGGVSD